MSEVLLEWHPDTDFFTVVCRLGRIFADDGCLDVAAQGDKADAADVDQIVLAGNLALTIPAGHPAVYRAAITQTTGGHTVTYDRSRELVSA